MFAAHPTYASWRQPQATAAAGVPSASISVTIYPSAAEPGQVPERQNPNDAATRHALSGQRSAAILTNANGTQTVKRKRQNRRSTNHVQTQRQSSAGGVSRLEEVISGSELQVRVMAVQA